jgi:uncharacterized protein involved in exopolysaccharide biosynthesis
MAAPDRTVPVAHLLGVVRRRWKGYLALVLLITIAAGALARSMPRRYEGQLVALPRANDRSLLLNSLGGQLGGLAALAGLGGGESGQRAEAIQVLQSRILAREFIEDNKLLPVLFASEWDERHQAWRGRARTLNDAVLYFDHGIRTVLEDRRTGLVTVRITWLDPAQAAAWANELVRRANNHLRARAVVRAQGAIEYLKREARNTDVVEIQQSLYRLMEDQYKTLLLANVSQDYAFSIIDPAVASDKRHFVSPHPRLYMFGALFFGGVLVLMAAFVEASVRAVQATGKDLER